MKKNIKLLCMTGLFAGFCGFSVMANAASASHGLAYDLNDAYNVLPAGLENSIGMPLTDATCNPSGFSLETRNYFMTNAINNVTPEHFRIFSDGSLWHINDLNDKTEQKDRIEITVHATCHDGDKVTYQKVINIEPENHLIYKIINAATYDPMTNSPEFGGIGEGDLPKNVLLVHTARGANRVVMTPQVPETWGKCTYTLENQLPTGLKFDGNGPGETGSGTISGIPQYIEPVGRTVIVKASCQYVDKSVNLGAALNFIVNNDTKK